MQKEIRTYAYLILSASKDVLSQPNEVFTLEFESGIILEGYISAEEQAKKLDNLNPIEEWAGYTTRISPVQFTLDWNPSFLLTQILHNSNCEPLFKYADDPSSIDKEYNLVFFDDVPRLHMLKEAIKQYLIHHRAEISLDMTRFFDVLMKTVSLAHQEQRPLLFVGAWGWNYNLHLDLIGERKSFFELAGFKFVDRHEPNSADSLSSLSSVGSSLSLQDKCVKNLKSICTAFFMYVSDNDEILPEAIMWSEQITDYLLRRDEVFSCPTDMANYHYMMNPKLGSIKYDNINQPERTVLFFEGEATYLNAIGLEESLPRERLHPDGNVIAFADGHIEVIDPHAYVDLYWEP